MTGHHNPAGSGTSPREAYRWQPRPVNIWLGNKPYNRLQDHTLQELRKRLESQGCLFVDTPDTETPLGPVAHLVIGFGANYEEEIGPLEMLGQLPKPRGMALMITTLDSIPEVDLFDAAREHLVRKAGHIGIVVEGDPNDTAVHRALWAAMAGNYRLLDGPEEAIFDSLVLRIQANVSVEKINQHEGDDESFITWEEWCALPLHQDIAQAAHALGEAGIIEDEVPLAKYGTSDQVRGVLRFLNRAALGEGMRSQLDPALRIMGVTTTGGGKVSLSPDPMDGQIVPVCRISWMGYVRALPAGCPITFNAPSVETHENGMIYLAGELVNAGLVNSLDSFLDYLHDHFSRHETIDILPEGMAPKVLAIDHFHMQPKIDSFRQPDRVEIVYPDPERFPEVDLPCGVREAELHLLSALFRSQAFSTPGPLDKVVLAVLPGHGTVALSGGPRRELTEMLVHGMEMEPVVRI